MSALAFRTMLSADSRQQTCRRAGDVPLRRARGLLVSRATSGPGARRTPGLVRRPRGRSRFPFLKACGSGTNEIVRVLVFVGVTALLAACQSGGQSPPSATEPVQEAGRTYELYGTASGNTTRLGEFDTIGECQRALRAEQRRDRRNRLALACH